MDRAQEIICNLADRNDFDLFFFFLKICTVLLSLFLPSISYQGPHVVSEADMLLMSIQC